MSLPNLDKKLKWILVGLFGIAMTLATIYDLRVTQLIFNPNSQISLFLWRFSELPVSMVALFSLAIVSVEFKAKGHRFQGLFKKALPFMTVIAGGIMGAQLGSYYESGQDVWIVMGVLTAYLMFGIAKKLNADIRSKLYSLAVRIIIVYAVAVILPNLLKILWGRPRYRIIGVDGMTFTPWYLPQGLTLINDDYKSFPSGHSAVAAVSLLSLYLPKYFTSLIGKESVLFVLSSLWTLIVMTSRIILGHHFLSDTIFGAGITIVTILLVKRYWKDSK